MTELLLLPLGVVAGIVTTLAGQGGGVFLLLCVTVLLGPHAALAATAPALLVGNLHRAILFRRDLDRATTWLLVRGAFPGAVVGGLFAGFVDPFVLKVVLVGLTAAAIAKALGWIRFSVPRSSLTVVGLAVGFMTGTSGGAGVLFAPVLLASGLTGSAFIGTIAAVATVTHVARVIAYGSVGMFSASVLASAAILTVAILVGNRIGESARKRLSPSVMTRLEYGVLVVCALLSVSGVS